MMSESKKKSAVGTAIPATETDNKSNSILADSEVIVKCAVSTKSLTDYQKLIIRRLWFTSRKRKELIRDLKKNSNSVHTALL